MKINPTFVLSANTTLLKASTVTATNHKVNVFITFADQGAAALAQRDYPDIKDKIFTLDINDAIEIIISKKLVELTS